MVAERLLRPVEPVCCPTCGGREIHGRMTAPYTFRWFCDTCGWFEPLAAPKVAYDPPVLDWANLATFPGDLPAGDFTFKVTHDLNQFVPFPDMAAESQRVQREAKQFIDAERARELARQRTHDDRLNQQMRSFGAIVPLMLVASCALCAGLMPALGYPTAINMLLPLMVICLMLLFLTTMLRVED